MTKEDCGGCNDLKTCFPCLRRWAERAEVWVEAIDEFQREDIIVLDAEERTEVRAVLDLWHKGNFVQTIVKE